MRKGSEKEKMKDSTSYIRAATTANGSATVAFLSRPLTSLGSHQGDHVSPYKLITCALKVITENCPIDDAIRRTVGLIDNFFKGDSQVVAERMKKRIQEMRKIFLVIGEPNFQNLYDILNMSVVKEKFSSDQIQDMQRQLSETTYHSNMTYLAGIFEEIAHAYLAQRNRVLFTSFPTEGNEIALSDEGPRIKTACHYLKVKANTIEALKETQDIDSFRKIIYEWLNLGPRQKGTVEKVFLGITKNVSSLNELANLVPEIREKIGELSKGIQDELKKLKDGDLIRMAAYFLRDLKTSLFQEVHPFNEHDINDIANAVLTLFWYPKVREDLLIKPNNTAEMEKLRKKYGAEVQPRTNNPDILYEVVANHLELVFLCFPDLVEYHQAIIDRFVDLVGRDAPEQNGVSISWGMNLDELGAFHEEVSTLMVSRPVIQSEKESVAPSPQSTPGKVLVKDMRYGNTETAALNDPDLSDDSGSSYTDSGKGSQRTSVGSSKPASGETSGDEGEVSVEEDLHFVVSREQMDQLGAQLEQFKIQEESPFLSPDKGNKR